MKKQKAASSDLPPRGARIGMIWYTQQDWQRLKATAIDPDKFKESFTQWEAWATANFEKAHRRDPRVQKVHIGADEFFAWCRLNLLTNIDLVRAEFIVQKMRAAARAKKADQSTRMRVR